MFEENHRCRYCGHSQGQHDQACPEQAILLPNEKQGRLDHWHRGFEAGRASREKPDQNPTTRLGWIEGDARADEDANHE